MPATQRPDKIWRREVIAAISRAERTDEFYFKVQNFIAQGLTEYRAWRAAAEEYDFIPQWEEFKRSRKEGMDRKRKKEKEQVEARILDLSQESGPGDPPAEVDKNIMRMEQVMDEGSGSQEEVDTIRDIKWIYRNMGRLFKMSKEGVESIDPHVIQEAPSSGAVGLAQYALMDKAKFYEKFVVKILPKDPEKELEDVEAKARAKMDPGLEELEKYLKSI